ncbi:Fe-S cluster assembly protein HesB [Herbiconiux sp. KACC 21604]|uniref:Fe-S cluster assembly protein HesB n=1 Tax=unclassified Herbiconiux TaxID=2618217 RepID=UPI001491027A|nr:Fe-S cluster assembly protein HesB [Herbiconiux sp. SALV-R1]QJU55779.1 Fe-S cluster assembly protein HesB [Herbiconiux sp. SALV-R1]WPO86988.1 Fe-S cluster assembly protein HesB [Herbiconiux sp. KACC 21604]
MLTLTENAGTVVKTLADRTVVSLGENPGASEAGLRISSAATNDSFDVAVAPRPEPTDQIVESAGARVYLEESVAPVLEDTVLDAQVDDAGSVHFSLARV